MNAIHATEQDQDIAAALVLFGPGPESVQSIWRQFSDELVEELAARARGSKDLGLISFEAEATRRRGIIHDWTCDGYAIFIQVDPGAAFVRVSEEELS